MDGDVIAWDPAVLAPGLAAGSTVRFTPTSGTPAEVRASDGQPIMTQQVVTLVDVQAPADTAALARLLNPIVPTITAESLGADLGKSDGKPITAVALREQDVEPVRDQARAVPGVELVQQTRLLTVDRALSSPVLADLATVWQGAAGRVRRVGRAAGERRRDGASSGRAGRGPGPGHRHHAGPAVADQGGGCARECSAAGRDRRTAGRPGSVLAVAQNAPADAQGAIALTGLTRRGRRSRPSRRRRHCRQEGHPGHRAAVPRHREHRGPADPERRQFRSRVGAAALGVRALVQHHDGAPGGGRCRRMRCNRPRCSSVSASTT